MFDIIKEILKQLMLLVNYRETKRRNFFEQHIDPLFKLMLKIQENYRNMFLDLQLKLAKESLTKKEILLNLNGKRNELADIRRLAYSTAKILKKHFNNQRTFASIQGRELMKNIRAFADHIILYFTLKPDFEGISTASYTLIKRLMDELEIYNDDDVVTEVEVKSILSEIVDHINTCWSKICNSYAEIKMQCYANNIYFKF